MDPWKWTKYQGTLRERTWKTIAKAQPMYTRRLDMIGQKMSTWSLWREPETPGHLCVWLGLAWSCGIREVSQNWPGKMRNGIVHHKSDRKSFVLPTADRNICFIKFHAIFYYFLYNHTRPFYVISRQFMMTAKYLHIWHPFSWNMMIFFVNVIFVGKIKNPLLYVS